MSRAVIIMIVAAIVVSGLEGVAEPASAAPDDFHQHGHEMHGTLHVADHEHDDDADHDDHFCHCGLHTAALISRDLPVVLPGSPLTAPRFTESFTSRHSPPLLRPPNA